MNNNATENFEQIFHWLFDSWHHWASWNTKNVYAYAIRRVFGLEVFRNFRAQKSKITTKKQNIVINNSSFWVWGEFLRYFFLVRWNFFLSCPTCHNNFAIVLIALWWAEALFCNGSTHIHMHKLDTSSSGFINGHRILVGWWEGAARRRHIQNSPWRSIEKANRFSPYYIYFFSYLLLTCEMRKIIFRYIGTRIKLNVEAHIIV